MWLKKIMDELKSDMEIAYAAVNEDGWAIEHLPFKLQNDKELILKAMENDWTSLKFVSEKLRI
jgi:hypothetical protein